MEIVFKTEVDSEKKSKYNYLIGKYMSYRSDNVITYIKILDVEDVYESDKKTMLSLSCIRVHVVRKAGLEDKIEIECPILIDFDRDYIVNAIDGHEGSGRYIKECIELVKNISGV